MGFWNFLSPDKGRSGKASKTLLSGEHVFSEAVEHIAVPFNSPFDLEAFRKASLASYRKRSTSEIARAACQVAQLISERLGTDGLRCMVPASEIDPSADPEAVPVHFLFMKDGKPKLAVAIVTRDGYNVPRVAETRRLCRNAGIGYQRIFASGTYADWIVDPGCPPQTVEKCKTRIIARIREQLQ